MLEAFRQANELALESHGTAVPAQWRECLDLIEEVFDSDKFLEKHILIFKNFDAIDI
jgi:hypothetical protein